MDDLEVSSVPLDARVEPGRLDRRYAVVDPAFAVKLRTEHYRRFEHTTVETPTGREQLTPDVPNAGADALEHLDDRGLPRYGTDVVPGTILIGMVTPHGGEMRSPEEKLLRAIFGEAAGELRDTSLRAPPGCFGVVTDVQLDPGASEGLVHAAVEVSWERPLDVGDVLRVNGEEVVVAAIAPCGADVAWSGGASHAEVVKVAMARDVLHARSIGPYSIVSQQPLVGREQFGGQPLLPAQVEQLAQRAPWALWEMMTIKADSVTARTRAYESIVRQQNPDVVPRPAAPAEPSASLGGGGGTADIFSFFATPAGAAPGEIPVLLPEVVEALQAQLRALGLRLELRKPAIEASLLSAEQLREGSHGQVRKPETLDARALEPVPEGLLCERIFGPTKDYECACGKYKRMKHRGVVCEQCGVEVISSRVRRERFGHVELAVPCLHPLLASEVALLLGLPESELREVAEGKRELVGEGQRWHAERRDEAIDPAHTGGRALWSALEQLDLEAIDAIESGPRAELASALADAERSATALMLTVLPVLPPDLRPLVVHGAGFASSDLNDLYRRVINRNNRLARLLELQAPDIIVVNEQAKLQEAIDELVIEGHRESGEHMRGLCELIDATFSRQVFTKAVDYSGVAHLVTDGSLARDECRVPRSMLLELFKPHAFGILEQRGYATTIKSAKKMVTDGRPEGLAAIEEASEGYPVLLMAEGTVVARRVRGWDEPAIAVDESTARRLASHAVTLHVPLMHEAALQCAALDDLGTHGTAPADGWLCRARAHGALARAVVEAVFAGERDELADPVVALSLGRPPEPMDDGEVERWAAQERARRAEVWERVRPEPERSTSSSAARNPALDRRVDELELSVRTSSVLSNAGIETIGQLCQRTEAELLKTKNCGRSSLKEIKEILAELGLSLGMHDA